MTLKELILAKKAALILAEQDNWVEAQQRRAAGRSAVGCFLQQVKIGERLAFIEEVLEESNEALRSPI